MEISGVENINYKELYHNALADPLAVDNDTLSTLVERFPYSQALRVVLARRRYREEEPHYEENDFLITDFPSWLYGDVTDDANAIDIPIASTYPTIDEAEPGVSDAVPPTHAEDGDAAVINIETVIPDVDDSGWIEHPMGADYFAYEEKTEADAVDSVDGQQGVVPLSEATPHEKISLYNDTHLPYSFLWWLNKARMEHADTYRPYAPKEEPTGHPQGSVDSPEDERILDHQIRENIFHLQSPEEKLSTPQPAETVSFHVSKKTDPIIERFIREEPQIKPPPADKINLENKARKSAEDQLSLVTETLANIYIEQGLYPKAIAIYKKLSLKYPEKSTYFAARITELTNKLP